MKEKGKFKSMLIVLGIFHEKMCSKIKIGLGFSNIISSGNGNSPFNIHKNGLNNAKFTCMPVFRKTLF